MRTLLNRRFGGLVIVLSLIGTLLAAACAGDMGPAGPTGSQGATGGSGAQGPGPSEADIVAAIGAAIPSLMPQIAPQIKGSTGRTGPPGLKGSTGRTGPPGSAGSDANVTGAALLLDKTVYTIDVDTSFTVLGSGFAEGELVIISLLWGGTEKLAAMGVADENGAFSATPSMELASEMKTKAKTVIPFLSGGVYTIRADGSEGSIATTPLWLVAQEK